MKRILSVMLVLAVMLTVFAAALPVQASTAMSFYVAVDGNDANDGSIGSPFATAEGARDAIRRLRAANGGELPLGGITVNFRGGRYERRTSFVLEEQDSGTARSPIVYRAFPGENVYWDGGIIINAADFEEVTDPELFRRTHRDARGHLLQFDLWGAGITNLGEIPVAGNALGGDFRLQPAAQMELAIDNVTMQLARYPNSDFELIRVDRVIDRGDSRFENPSNPTRGGTIQISSDQPNTWRDLDDIWVWGWMSWHFYDDQLQVVDFDLENRQITFGSMAYAGLVPWCAYGQNSFYFFNIFEEIDMPGEYVIDRNTGILYLLPPVGFSDNSLVQLSVLDDDMVLGTDVSFVTFAGMSFENSRYNAFTFIRSDNIMFTNGNIRNLGGWAMWACEFSQAIGIAHSSIYDTGHGGFRTEGWEGRRIPDEPIASITPNNYFFVGNDAFRTARIHRTYRPPVTFHGADNVASFNRLHENPQMAYLYHGVGNIFEFNHVFGNTWVTSDTGITYSYGENVNFDNHIRFNFFHDNGRAGHAIKELYFDGGKGHVVFGNIFTRFVGENVILSNSNTQHNHIFNNIFIANTPRLNVTQNMTRNWPLGREDYLAPIRQSHPEVWNAWYERYPLLALHGDADMWDDNANNYAFNNVYLNHSGNIFHGTISFNRQDENWIANSMNLSTLFVDPANDNFRLLPNSPIFTELPDFEDIPKDYLANFELYYARRMAGTISLYVGNSSAMIGTQIAAIDPDNAEVRPLIVDGRTLVPVRFIAESLGADVQFDDGIITITLGTTVVRMTVGSTSMSRYGHVSELDVPPQIIENRTMVPLRAIVEAFGMSVFWDDRGLIVLYDGDNLPTSPGSHFVHQRDGSLSPVIRDSIFEVRPAQGSADFFLVLETITRLITN